MLDELRADLRYRLRALFRRDVMERDLDDELRFHLEHEIEKRVSLGISHAEAERQVYAAFGGLSRIKDDARDARGVALVENVVRDFRYALRALRLHPWFTLAVVVTLGAGVGVNAAMFGVLDRLFLRPPAYLVDPSSVDRVYVSSIGTNGDRSVDRHFSYATYEDLAR